MITKDQEIFTLRQLYEQDSYFSDEFKKEEVDQMCQNIQNDLHLLYNTNFVRLTNKNREVIKSVLQKEINRMIVEIDKMEAEPIQKLGKINCLKLECMELIFASNKL